VFLVGILSAGKPFFLGMISQNSERTSVEVWNVDQPCEAVFIRGKVSFEWR
jgi:hypothetical protein